MLCLSAGMSLLVNNVNIPEVTFEKQVNIIIYNTYCTRTCIKATPSCQNLKTEKPLNLKKHFKKTPENFKEIQLEICFEIRLIKISKLFINFFL